jgi:hypothetical protein
VNINIETNPNNFPFSANIIESSDDYDSDESSSDVSDYDDYYE